MAANGFPAGEREGELKSPRRGIPEPLGEVFLFFLILWDAKTRSWLKNVNLVVLVQGSFLDPKID
jgi:hypothetical protein